jgi:Flp pilus assembly protein TadB
MRSTCSRSCVEAGLGFDAALAQVARNTTGPLAAEFSRVLQEIQIGKSRSQALRAMTERTTVPGCGRSCPRWCRPATGHHDRRRTA